MREVGILKPKPKEHVVTCFCGSLMKLRWAARAALCVEFTAKKKRINYEPDYLTRGIREAYKNGLEIAVPTGPDELGWSDKK